MTVPTPATLDALLRGLDGEGTAAERERLLTQLQADPALAEQLRASLLVEHLLVSEQLARDDGFTTSVLDRCWSPHDFAVRTVRRHRRSRAHWLLAALVLLTTALVGGLWWRHASQPPPLLELRLHEVSGTVFVQEQERISEAQAGEPLRVGDVLISGTAAATELRLADGTSLSLGTETRLVVLGEADFRLERGRIAAQVRPRPAQAPLRIRARGAEVTVLGTRFSLGLESEADDAHALVAVEEGRVAVDHDHGGRTTLGADEALRYHATGAATRLVREHVATAFAHEWTADFPNDRSLGLLDPTAGGTRPEFSKVDHSGNRLMRISTWGPWPHGFAALEPGDALRIRGRFAAESFMVCIVGVRRPDETMTNLITTVTGSELQVGEHELSLPIARFRPTDGDQVPPGSRYMFYLLMPVDRLDFVLHEVAIERYRYREVGGAWD